MCRFFDSSCRDDDALGVHGDVGVTYDLMNGVEPQYQRENLRVELLAKMRSDIGGVHMVGPIVEVLSIQAR